MLYTNLILKLEIKVKKIMKKIISIIETSYNVFNYMVWSLLFIANCISIYAQLFEFKIFSSPFHIGNVICILLLVLFVFLLVVSAIIRKLNVMVFFSNCYCGVSFYFIYKYYHEDYINFLHKFIIG
jgi:hypothetical protein